MHSHYLYLWCIRLIILTRGVFNATINALSIYLKGYLMTRPTVIYFVEALDTRDPSGKWFLWPDNPFDTLEKAQGKIEDHHLEIDDKTRYLYRLVPYARQPAIPDQSVSQPEPLENGLVCILDHVPYLWNENLDLKPNEFVVSVSRVPMLKKLRAAGIFLAYDGSMSQGLDIHNRNNEILGHVIVFGNSNWLKDLTDELVKIAEKL